MENKQEQTNSIEERKTRIMVLGVGIGAIVGFLSSYLYARAAQENDNPDAGKAESISTGQLLAIVLAVMGLLRQISELGKPSKDKKKK